MIIKTNRIMPKKVNEPVKKKETVQKTKKSKKPDLIAEKAKKIFEEIEEEVNSSDQ